MKMLTNQNGFSYILALTIVMIMGIMLGITGQTWKTIKHREQEKELLFRGSQIKEAIENWYNLKNPPLKDLKDLVVDSKNPNKNKYLPQFYMIELNNKEDCGQDCPEMRIYEDPMTGKKWKIIKCDQEQNNINTYSYCKNFHDSNAIIGVASKSEEASFKTDFTDTSLEEFVKSSVYSKWEFKASPSNKHSSIYKAYHEYGF